MSYPPPLPQFSQGSMRQWEAHVRRMITRGVGREEILYSMTSANIPYQDAQALVSRIGSSERWKAAGMMIGGGALALLTGIASFVALSSPQGGVVWYGPCFVGIGLFIYGLVRLAKMRV